MTVHVSNRLDGARPAPADRLTSRERVILAYVAAGLSNTGISRRMYLSVKTVEAHVSAIFAKLDLHTHADENRRVAAVLIWLAASGSERPAADQHDGTEELPSE